MDRETADRIEKEQNVFIDERLESYNRESFDATAGWHAIPKAWIEEYGEEKKPTEAKAITYLLRNIPLELWKKAKHRGADTGQSLRDIILNALEVYLS